MPFYCCRCYTERRHFSLVRMMGYDTVHAVLVTQKRPVMQSSPWWFTYERLWRHLNCLYVWGHHLVSVLTFSQRYKKYTVNHHGIFHGGGGNLTAILPKALHSTGIKYLLWLWLTYGYLHYLWLINTPLSTIDHCNRRHTIIHNTMIQQEKLHDTSMFYRISFVRLQKCI